MEPKLSRAGARAIFIMSLDDTYDFQDIETLRSILTSVSTWDELPADTQKLVSMVLSTRGLSVEEFA